MRFIILFFLVLKLSILPAQNLVPNPGFEKYKKIPQSFCHNSKEFTGMLANWTLPNLGTSDYFNSLSKANASTIKNNFVGFQKPQEGNAYCGMYVLETLASNYRECLQVKLLKPLVAGQQYAVTYYVSLAEASEYAVDRLGAAFYKKQVKQNNSQNIAGGAMTETPDSVFFDSRSEERSVGK